MITYSDVTMSYSNTPPPQLYIKNLILHPAPPPPHSTTGTVLGISNGFRRDTENFAKQYANICYQAGP